MALLDPATLTALDALTVGDALGTLPPAVQAGLAGLMTACAAWAAHRPGALRVLAFLAAGFVFSRANHAFEGPVLVTFTPDHGLVLADLVPVALAALVARRALSARSHRTPRTREGSPAGYLSTHGALRVRLRPAAVPAAEVPRGTPRHRAR